MTSTRSTDPPKAPRVYQPFHGWMFGGPFLDGQNRHNCTLSPYLSEIGQVERTEKNVRDHGLLYYRDPVAALLAQGAGRTIYRLELVGPCADYADAGFAKQRTALWEAYTAHILHEWAAWLIEDNISRIHAPHLIRRTEAWIAAKRAAIRPGTNDGCEHFRRSMEEPVPNKATSEMASSYPLECAKGTFRAPNDTHTFRSTNGQGGSRWPFRQRASAELDRLLLTLAPGVSAQEGDVSHATS